MPVARSAMSRPPNSALDPTARPVTPVAGAQRARQSGPRVSASVGRTRRVPLRLASWVEVGLFATLAIWTFGYSQPVLADCPGTRVSAEAVRRLVGSPSVAALDRQFSECDRSDPALVAVYRQRRLELMRTGAEEVRYLEGLPSTQEALQRIDELSWTRGICEDATVSRVVYDMFDTAADLVQRHRGYHVKFIQLCMLTDGLIGEVAWPAFDRLLQQDRGRTLEALRSLPRETRMRLCGGRDPRSLTDSEAGVECRSGL
jgi:hypothetical protein